MQVNVYPYHINDPEFAEVLVNSFLEITSKNTDSCGPKMVLAETSQDLKKTSFSESNLSAGRNIGYSPSDFPEKRPGYYRCHSLDLLLLESTLNFSI